MLDPILFLNQALLDLHRKDFTHKKDNLTPCIPGPTGVSRAFALVHLALAGAWFGAAGDLSALPAVLFPLPKAAGSASREAAACAATVHALSQLWHQPRFAEPIRQITARFATSFLTTQSPRPLHDGKRYGQRLAERLVAQRRDDGSQDASSYVWKNQPGRYRSDPFEADPDSALHPRWGHVRPFIIDAHSVGARVPAPHSLSSPLFAKHFNEVKTYGVDLAARRNAEKDLIGVFWAYDEANNLGTSPRLYNQCLQAIIAQRSVAADDACRLLTAANLAMADAAIVAWQAKYEYCFWRPVRAIRETKAGQHWQNGGINKTLGHSFWLPYGAPQTNGTSAGRHTPNSPSYPSGHAAIGTACFKVIEAFFAADPEDFTFEIMSDEFNDRSRDPNGATRPRQMRRLTLARAIEENNESRIWLGLNWRMDVDAGALAGLEIARDVARAFGFAGVPRDIKLNPALD